MATTENIAGELRHRVTIQYLSATTNLTTGIVTEAWTTFATVWAKVSPVAVREFQNEVVAGGIASAKISARIKIRYITGVVSSMRVTHHDRTFNIEAVLPDDLTGLQYLTLAVSEVLYG
jgi:SPP1 family predicted phage head-tail adaptor